MSTTISAVAPKVYVQRTPQRFTVERAREDEPAVDLNRGYMPTDEFPPEDYDLTAPARAVLEAKASTCRFVFGDGPAFRFCGEPATVEAGGRLTYCPACARRMYDRPVHPPGYRPPNRKASDRPFICR